MLQEKLTLKTIGMKAMLLACLIGFFGISTRAQVTRVSLQASGLTCSMCSKAVQNALQKVSFVDKVQVDIKNQQYNLSFRDSAAIDFDALVKAVEDAGFSVASFQVTANLSDLRLQKDEHVRIGSQYFHFLNASGQELNGPATFTVVDKSYTKNYKKFSSLSKMECVRTGRSASCCAKANAQSSRIYHVII